MRLFIKKINYYVIKLIYVCDQQILYLISNNFLYNF